MLILLFILLVDDDFVLVMWVHTTWMLLSEDFLEPHSSQVAIVEPPHYVSIIDKAMVGCFLLVHAIMLIPKGKAKTNVDCVIGCTAILVNIS